MPSAPITPIVFPPDGAYDPDTFRQIKEWRDAFEAVLASMRAQIQVHENHGQKKVAEDWAMIYNCVRDGFEQVLSAWLATYTLHTTTLRRLSQLPLPLQSSSSTLAESPVLPDSGTCRPLPAPSEDTKEQNDDKPGGEKMDDIIREIRKGMKEVEGILKSGVRMSVIYLPSISKRPV